MIVTRPAREAGRWVEALRSAGWGAEALPLIDIRPVDDLSRVRACQAAARDYDALMFVSPQAVRHFAAPSWIDSSVRCWAPGPGTAQALMDCGVAPERIGQPSAEAAQFDSDALWAVVAPEVQSGHRLLLVRGQSGDGSTGRDELIRRCVAAGGEVDSCVVYQRACPSWNEADQRRARDRLDDGSIWLFSSSEALAHLRTLLPTASCVHARALVTHPRIEMSAQRMGFGEIITTRPALNDVLRGLESCR